MKKRHPIHDFLVYHSCGLIFDICQKISNLANRFAVHIEHFATHFAMIQIATEIKHKMNMKWLEEMRERK